LPGLLAVATVVLASAAGFGTFGPHRQAGRGTGAQTADPAPVRAQPLAPEPSRQPAPDAVPVRLRAPVIGLDTALIRLAVGADGALQPPADYDRAGWYAAGTLPGQVGPAVVAGHVDSWTGPAVFARLHELHPGDLVEVVRSDRSVTFRIETVTQYPKDRFPTASVYGPTPDAQLRLITCGGQFDTGSGSYRDNIIVYAVAAS
jgi:sortase (surface protein transpeptidase)